MASNSDSKIKYSMLNTQSVGSRIDIHDFSEVIEAWLNTTVKIREITPVL